MGNVSKWLRFNLASIVAVVEIVVVGIAALTGLQWLMLIVFGYMLGTMTVLSLQKAGYL